jgi:uncharacterized protein YcfJ
MKRTLLVVLLAATGTVSAQAQSFVDRARVVSAEPQYETVQVPRQECGSQWTTEPRTVGMPVTTSNGTSYGGAIIGGIAGAIVGNQVGKGHGREAATAAGAVVGALAGNSIANRGNQGVAVAQEYEQREVRSCRTVMDKQQRANGYRVTYSYNGNEYATVTREHPGNTLPVRVSVTPEPEYHRR